MTMTKGGRQLLGVRVAYIVMREGRELEDDKHEEHVHGGWHISHFCANV
jgi:hypothetical protein